MTIHDHTWHFPHKISPTLGSEAVAEADDEADDEAVAEADDEADDEAVAEADDEAAAEAEKTFW
jgi:hypothetical protein